MMISNGATPATADELSVEDMLFYRGKMAMVW